VSGRPYALKTGDCILIEPYEIAVSIDDESDRRARSLDDPFGGEDPFAPVSGAGPFAVPDLVSPPDGDVGSQVDPLQFFDPLSKHGLRKQAPPTPSPADDWHGAHYNPPAARPDPDLPASESGSIPQGWNPLDEAIVGPTPPHPRPRPGPPAESRPKPKPVMREPPPPPVAAAPTVPESVDVSAPPIARAVVPAGTEGAGLGGLMDVLTGAGLQDSAVTPELARNLGEILRVVVSGLMDVLQARQRIKEEFGMRQTIFRPADNNPLKFSANVEDALHNLLVKRNAAYLAPVEAFEDAFDDLRSHQIAMLSGMRVAFEFMLAEFDPNRMQEEFDRQLKKGSLLSVPAKLRYWDLFREKRDEIAKDPETSFRELFGEEFAKEYEEQLRRLKVQGKGGKT
jgi:type VI secretion system FHA domain protein